MPESIPDEEMAYKIVQLYVEKVSQRGEKRQMGLDTIINAYFYTLLRLQRKKRELGIIEPAVEKEENTIETADVEQINFPESAKSQFDFD